MRQYEIKIECNEVLYQAIVLMLKYMKVLGGQGSSRWCSIYCDGDGVDRIKQLWVSQDVPYWNCVKENGDFKVDTDEIYAFQRKEHPSQKIKENTQGESCSKALKEDE